MKSTASQDAHLSFPDRLRLERERLGLSQSDFGKRGHVSKMAQWTYEQGRHWPSVEYLESLKSEGVDVGYLVTGRRTDGLDWEVLRNAFLFVQRTLASRPDRNFTDDQLFEAFKSVVEAAMGLTRPDLIIAAGDYEETTPTIEAHDRVS